jgi:sugar-specific transcriptional regulator TrmB
MKQKPVIEALEAANNALQSELENREKLKEELQASEPKIREAIQSSEKARSLAEEVQEKQVNEKVLEIAVREAQEALSETQAVLEQELEKRKVLERAMEETKHAIVNGIDKSEEAKERLRLQTHQPVNGN